MRLKKKPGRCNTSGSEPCVLITIFNFLQYNNFISNTVRKSLVVPCRSKRELRYRISGEKEYNSFTILIVLLTTPTSLFTLPSEKSLRPYKTDLQVWPRSVNPVISSNDNRT